MLSRKDVPNVQLPLRLRGNSISRPWRRLFRHPLFKVGATFLLFLLLFSFLGPEVWRSTNRINLGAILSPPSVRHPLGTDALGRDYLRSLMLGGRIPIFSGFVAAIAATTIGMTSGLAAAMVRHLEAPLLRVADAFLSVPQLVPILIIEAFLGTSVVALMGSVVLMTWPTTTRLVWSRTLVLRELPYVEAARAGGASEWHILTRHILPNASDTVVACFATQFGNSVLFIALATVLGTGLGTASDWASMIATSFQYLSYSDWWLVVPPGICFAMLILSVFFLAEAVRQALNPRSQNEARLS